jgi:flagellar export protein FliJ
MADPLATVLRLRQLALDQARAELAQANRDEAACNAERDARIRELVREARAGPRAAEDALFGSFAAWLPAAQMGIASAEAADASAAASVTKARTHLAEQQAALKAARTLHERRQAELAIRTIRKSQRQMDEAGARRGAMQGPHTD